MKTCLMCCILFLALFAIGCGDGQRPTADDAGAQAPTSTDRDTSADRDASADSNASADSDGPAQEHPTVEVDDNTFASVVLESEQPVLVDFWAPWCGPCRTLGPVVEQIAAEYQGRVTVAKLNVDEAPGTAQKYDITGIPALLFVQNGQVVETMVGVQSKSALTKQLDAMLAE